MNDCLFCKIAARGIPSECVYEDDKSFAFLDIKPINPGHILLIPKKHYENLHQIPDEDLSHLAPILKKLADAAKEATSADGINIGMNNGASAGQLIFHAHFHIMPRHKDDGHTHWAGTPYKEGEMTQTAEKIRELL